MLSPDDADISSSLQSGDVSSASSEAVVVVAKETETTSTEQLPRVGPLPLPLPSPVPSCPTLTQHTDQLPPLPSPPPEDSLVEDYSPPSPPVKRQRRNAIKPNSVEVQAIIAVANEFRVQQAIRFFFLKSTEPQK